MTTGTGAGRWLTQGSGREAPPSWAMAAVGLYVLASVFGNARIPVAGRNALVEQFALLLLIGVTLAWSGSRRRVLRASLVPALGLLGAWIALGAVVSVLVPPDPAASLGIVIWLACSWLGCVCLVALAPPVRTLVSWAVAAALLAASIGIVLYLAHLAFGVSMGGRPGDNIGWAVFGISMEPNALALQSMVWAVVVVAAALRWDRPRLLWASLPLIVVIPLTQTRSAVLGLLLALVVLGVARRRVVARWVGATVRTPVVLAQVAGAGVIIAVSMIPLVQKFLVTAPSGGDLSDAVGEATTIGSSGYRAQALAAVNDDFDGILNRIFGLGVNSFPQRNSVTDASGVTTSQFNSNLFFQVYYDTGIVGLVLVGIAAVLLVRNSVDRAAALAVMGAFAVGAFFSSFFWFANTWILIALAVLTARATEGKARDAQDAESRPT